MAKALLCTQCLGVLAATPIGDTAVDQGGIHRRIINSTGQDRIVFPAEKVPAKKLLQFLNEELFWGATTERLFETNSKRIAD